MAFKTLDMRQQRAVILERWKSKNVNSKSAKAYYPEKDSKRTPGRAW